MDDAARDLNVLLDLGDSVRVVPIEPLTVEPFRPDLDDIRALARERNPDYLEARLVVRSAENRITPERG